MLFYQKEKEEKKAAAGADIKAMRRALKAYQEAKREFDRRVLENEDWFHSRHWQYIKGRQRSLGHEPTTPFLLNAVWNKHADAMDNYPEPVFLEREEEDREEAELLSGAVPLILEKNGFEQVYSDVWWQKIKQGTGIYYVGWDAGKEGGLGDIVIKKIDLLRFFAEPHLENIQDSRYVFLLSLADTAAISRQFPGKRIVSDAPDYAFQTYSGNSRPRDLQDRCCVVDCYEKGYNSAGKKIVHLTKFVGETILYSTREDPQYREKGLYAHGQYPFVADCFLPRENSIFGTGLIECAKSTQAYIDRLDYLIEANALTAGRQRWLVKRSSGVRIQDLQDLSNDFIECDSSVDDSAVRPIQANPIPGYIVTHRQNKINELKEVIGNRDFSQGGTAGGVTAYSAISALQEAGNKLSRDTVKASYRAFQEVIGLCVELIREFYGEERFFRISGEGGKADYIALSNRRLLKKAVSGEGGEETFRQAVFDIKILPRRKNSFDTNSHNQLILQLLEDGAFERERLDSTMIALEAMILDNKGQIIRALQRKKQATEKAER